MSARCGDCRFYGEVNQWGGHCRVKSPAVVRDRDGDLSSVWPWVQPVDWCGEFAPRVTGDDL